MHGLQKLMDKNKIFKSTPNLKKVLFLKVHIDAVLLHLRLESKSLTALVALVRQNVVLFVKVVAHIFQLDKCKATHATYVFSKILVDFDMALQSTFRMKLFLTYVTRISLDYSFVTLFVLC